MLAGVGTVSDEAVFGLAAGTAGTIGIAGLASFLAWPWGVAGLEDSAGAGEGAATLTSASDGA